MKLTDVDLRQLYLSNLEDEIPPTRKECPSPKELLRLFRTKKPDKKKTRIIGHITKCFYCANEFEFIIKALRYETQMNVVAKKLLLAKKENFESKNLIHRIFSMQSSWKIASFIVLAFAVFTFISIYTLSLKQKNPIYRATSHSQIKLIQPEKAKISKTSLSFRWEHVTSSDYYVLEIFDESLYQLWKSPKITETSTILPHKITSGMQKNKTYFWMVTVFFANGKVIESPLQEFYLIE